MVWGIEMTIDKAGKLKAHQKHVDKIDSVLDSIPKLETRIDLILETVPECMDNVNSVLACQNTVLEHMEEVDDSNSILYMISKLKTRVNWAIVLLVVSIILMILCLMK